MYNFSNFLIFNGVDISIWFYRSYTKIGFTAHECKGAYYISCQKPSSGTLFSIATNKVMGKKALRLIHFLFSLSFFF